MEEKKTNILSEEVNGENIQDVISASSKVTEEVVTKAAEKIAEKRKEKLTNDLINVVQSCEYTKAYTALQVRRSNRSNQRIKQYMKDLNTLVEEVKSGKKPVTAWEKESRELKKQFDKDLIEIGKNIDESINELREIFPGVCWWNNDLISGLDGGRSNRNW